MKVFYLPVWKQDNGDRFVFRGDFFDSEDRARISHVNNFMYYAPCGLSMDGIINIKTDDNGDTLEEFPHCEAEISIQGVHFAALLIGGPTMDKKLAAAA